jgi:hypothetical protein
MPKSLVWSGPGFFLSAMCNLRIFPRIHTIEDAVECTIFCVPYRYLLDRVHTEEARHLEKHVISSMVELSYSFLMKNHKAVFPLQAKQLVYKHKQIELNV